MFDFNEVLESPEYQNATDDLECKLCNGIPQRWRQKPLIILSLYRPLSLCENHLADVVNSYGNKFNKDTRLCADCGCLVEKKDWSTMGQLSRGRDICEKCFTSHTCMPAIGHHG